jgi:uncharacterized protein YaiI (UPF0178 family)
LRKRHIQKEGTLILSVKIWIDADACPRVIKDIVIRASERLQLPVLLVANKDLSKAETRLVSAVTVSEGPDIADDYIVRHAKAEDLVITADIPLAARIVAKGGVALDPRGELYTEENVGERLSLRDLMQQLRSEGLVQGGPNQFGQTDRNRFASALDRMLTRILKGQREYKE